MARVIGADLVAARLQNLGEITNATTREVIRQGAQDIQKLAREYAPHDSGALEHAIVIVEEQAGSASRKTFVVGIDESQRNGAGEPVGQYAREMHDNYDAYQPGEGTAAKRSAGLKAGGRFLERAGMELAPKIMRRVRAAIDRALSRMGR